MNPLGGLATSLFTTLTGTDPTTLQSQLTQAEQLLILAVEIALLLLTGILVGEMFILWEVRRG